ncbi:MAG: porin, partial [Bermanella sp.]
MRNNFVWALTFCMLAAPPFAAAELQFNGFASVVTGIDLEDDSAGDYGGRTVDNLQESRVALQWTADIQKGLRFVGQTVARGNATTGFTLNYDWAYFDFNVGDSAKFKFGRLRIPFYKYSDYLDVGYAYHWITPPKSMYSLDFSNLDGIGYQQNIEAGGMEHAL